MWSTCKYRDRMPKMLQVRNVPDSLHRILKARAALEGLSLSDYVLRELRRTAERPTPEELRRRIESRHAVEPHPSPAQALAEERARR